jgi:hypothetical protein
MKLFHFVCEKRLLNWLRSPQYEINWHTGCVSHLGAGWGDDVHCKPTYWRRPWPSSSPIIVNDLCNALDRLNMKKIDILRMCVTSGSWVGGRCTPTYWRRPWPPSHCPPPLWCSWSTSASQPGHGQTHTHWFACIL